MKKLVAMIGAVVLFIGTVFGFSLYLNSEIQHHRNAINYTYTKTKADCLAVMEKPINENTLLVFGSSEFCKNEVGTFPDEVFNQSYSDFNLSLVGTASQQSLSHAIQLGALANKLPEKKVALVLSPQWFTKSHLDSAAFASRFDPLIYKDFIKNSKLSVETKTKIVNRCEQLLVSDQKQLKNVRKYRAMYLDNNPSLADMLMIKTSGWFYEMKAKYDFLKETPRDTEKKEPIIKASEIDYSDLMNTAMQHGKLECTNNPFYIRDDYYNTYIKPVLDTRKNAEVDLSYCDSPEYDDLRLFLDVCKDSEITPLLVIVPVNGFWYDYTGFPKADREQYYQNIRDIAASYGVSIADFSKDEHSPYFLRDIMHLGWKGWAQVDQSLYEFYKQN